MLTVESATEKLKLLGYTPDAIKQIILVFVSTGEVDEIEYHLSSDGVKII